MDNLLALKNNKKKNDKLIMKRFNKFIGQNKEFGDDIFGLIKEFMISDVSEYPYTKFKEQTILYNNNFIPNEVGRMKSSNETQYQATEFFIGKRYGNLIEATLLRTADMEMVENPQKKMYKIHTFKRFGNQISVDGMPSNSGRFRIDVRWGCVETSYRDHCRSTSPAQGRLRGCGDENGKPIYYEGNELIEFIAINDGIWINRRYCRWSGIWINGRYDTNVYWFLSTNKMFNA